MLTIGIDDAGRGPVLGPMILAGVLVDDSLRAELRALGIKDSKQVIHSTRVRLAKVIREKVVAYKVVKSYPEEIDEAVLRGRNLNTLEAQKTAELINLLNTKKDKIKVIIDCPSVNPTAWRKTLSEFIEHPDNLEIVCEHKADVNHPEVSAASILAKVAREEEVEKLKKEYGNIGSGYPADPDTKEFLKKNGKKLENSGIFRKSWSTWKKLIPADNQKTLF
jgi:ribonuclease HII